MKILVITAHPQLNSSRANKTLLQSLVKYGGDILIHDLYQLYPNWDIDVKREQELLLQYDRIVLQFPFYWYSSPPLLKKWLDEVMTFGWAYGPGGHHLIGKEFLIATTTGGTENAYRSGGDNQFTISEFLRPFERTITRCNGIYLPAFVSYAVMTATDEALEQEAIRYLEHIGTPMPVLVH
jgi:Putative NADPH-quinone reductase (modulator of drug activity B)